eukprot:786168-Pleurochrysis_carterae.AAC.2
MGSSDRLAHRCGRTSRQSLTPPPPESAAICKLADYSEHSCRDRTVRHVSSPRRMLHAFTTSERDASCERPMRTFSSSSSPACG